MKIINNKLYFKKGKTHTILCIYIICLNNIYIYITQKKYNRLRNIYYGFTTFLTRTIYKFISVQFFDLCLKV